MKYALFISYTLAASVGTIGDGNSGTQLRRANMENT
jgi:hypothetical protein